MADSLLSLVVRRWKKKEEERKRATEWMWWSEREKRRIRFHPGSPAVLLIEVSTLGEGGIQPIKIKLHFN